MAETATIGHCKDCKRFGPEVFTAEGWRACLRTGQPGVLFEVVGWSGDEEMYVSPDFGCVQFEAKQ